MSKIDTSIIITKLREFCHKNNVNIIEFAPNSFRLQKSMHPTIDIYPKRLRVFNHADQDWGDITDLEKFLKYQFG